MPESRKTKRTMPYHARRKVEGTLFILPWAAGFLLFWAFPLVSSLMQSFRGSDLNKLLGVGFLGLENYENVIADVNFGVNLSGSLMNSLFNIPLIVIFSMFVAVLLNRKMAGRGFFRAVFFLPVIIAGAIMGGLNRVGAGTLDFSAVFAQGTGALVNLLGSDVMDRLGTILWQSSVQILVFLAGLQTISPTLYEAASIDGASGWEMFWKITVPQLAPIVLLNVIYSIVDSFTSTSNPMVDYIKDILYRGMDAGFSAALSWMYMLVILAIIGGIFLLFRLFTREKKRARRYRF